MKFKKKRRNRALRFLREYIVLEHSLKSNMRTILLIRCDLAFVLFDDCLCHGKSYTVATRELSCFIGAVEAVKESVKFDLSNGGIGIFNRQHNSSATVECYTYFAALIAILNGIVKQNANKSM